MLHAQLWVLHVRPRVLRVLHVRSRRVICVTCAILGATYAKSNVTCVTRAMSALPCVALDVTCAILGVTCAASGVTCVTFAISHVLHVRCLVLHVSHVQH